jgi:tRNA (mo5U34)-methyltransferase
MMLAPPLAGIGHDDTGEPVRLVRNGSPRGPMPHSRETVHELVASHSRWRHRIQLPHGVVTPGSEDTDEELRRLRLPANMAGLRVLDIGCSDGFFSFECEHRGASRVLAIDDFSSLLSPGANGFAIACELLESTVEFRRTSVYELDPGTHGTFDLILFLNVIYHLRHPLLALERIKSVLSPSGRMYLKSYFHQDLRAKLFGRTFGLDLRFGPWARFYPGSELGSDPTNWWGPNAACLHAMLDASGFKDRRELGRFQGRLYIRCGNAD